MKENKREPQQEKMKLKTEMQKLRKNNKTRKESKLQVVLENIIKYLSNQAMKPESEKERK